MFNSTLECAFLNRSDWITVQIEPGECSLQIKRFGLDGSDLIATQFDVIEHGEIGQLDGNASQAVGRQFQTSQWTHSRPRKHFVEDLTGHFIVQLGAVTVELNDESFTA